MKEKNFDFNEKKNEKIMKNLNHFNTLFEYFTKTPPKMILYKNKKFELNSDRS